MQTGSGAESKNLEFLASATVVAAIACSSLNLVPLLLVPLAVAIVLACRRLVVDRATWKVLIALPQRYFILFSLWSLVFAALIGVNIFIPELYRREFKYDLPFAMLIGFSMLSYWPIALKTFQKTFIIVGLVTVVIFVGAKTLIRPTSGLAHALDFWDNGVQHNIYHGLFLTHSAAGGFYAILLLFALTFLATYKQTSLTAKALLAAVSVGMIACLIAASSRAYLLGGIAGICVLAICAVVDSRINTDKLTIAVLFTSVVLLIFGLWLSKALSDTEMAFQTVDSQAAQYSATLAAKETLNNVKSVTPAKAGIQSFQEPWHQLSPARRINQSFPKEVHSAKSKVEAGTMPERIVSPAGVNVRTLCIHLAQANGNSNRTRNISVRLILWRRAIEDFLGSPIVGVGPSRFDDDALVLCTSPWVFNEGTEIPPLRVRKLHVPWFEINIGHYQAHTDQHAHNVYLNTLAEGGLVLFALFLIMYVSLLRRLWAIFRKRSTDGREVLALGVIVSIACLAVASIFGDNLLGVIPLVTLMPIIGYLFALTNSTEGGISRDVA